MKALIVAVVLVAVAAPGMGKDSAQIQIHPGTNGTTYCTPMDDPSLQVSFQYGDAATQRAARAGSAVGEGRAAESGNEI